ncbi:hypothetical protein COJ02_21165 [Bacillus thuringiensis]|nr:hypothetical protein COJ02_21165 [Bacillus thuringiensis]PFR42511.1 hypothetical protein COK27_10855 [Bacillus thuringiensis]PGL25982.1 hypothetical protein CN921_11795 [Bacillus thuringiensis]
MNIVESNCLEKAIQRILHSINETSPNETAVIFKISSPGLIRKWRIQLHQKGVDALKPKKKGHQSMD